MTLSAPDVTDPRRPNHAAREASPLFERHERMRRLRAREYLRRLTQARLDLAMASSDATAELLSAADLPVDLEWQAHQILTAPLAEAGLFDLAQLLRRLSAEERQTGRQVERLTAVVVEQLRDCPAACLPRIPAQATAIRDDYPLVRRGIA